MELILLSIGFNALCVSGLSIGAAGYFISQIFKERRLKGRFLNDGSVTIPVDSDKRQRRTDVKVINKVLKETNDTYGQSGTVRNMPEKTKLTKAELKRRKARKRHNNGNPN